MRLIRVVDEKSNTWVFVFKKIMKWGFPGGSVIKNPPASAGDIGLIPGWQKSHMPWNN